MNIEAIAQKIADLEKKDRFDEISAEISRLQFTPDSVIHLTLALYNALAARTALAMVRHLDRLNISHPFVDFAAAHLGIMMDDSQWIDRLENRWQGRFEEFRAAFPHRHAALADEISKMAASGINTDNDGRVSASLRVARVLSADVERIFPEKARKPRAVVLGKKSVLPPQTKLYADLPPVRRKPRRVAVVCRQWWSTRNSRPYEVGPRITNGCLSAGWDATFVPVEMLLYAAPIHAAFAAVEKLNEKGSLDAVFFDQFGCPPNRCVPPAEFTAFADRIRARSPGVRIVPIYLDPWQQETWPDMREFAPSTDFMWSAWPSLEIWHDPRISGKAVVLPFPLGLGAKMTVPKGRTRTLSFVGSIYQYNFYRAFWIVQAKNRRIPIHFDRRSHNTDDGLPAMESYRRYLQLLARENYPLNFSMRRDGRRVYTGRSLEAIAIGRCLVQEKNMDLHEMYTPGRHYLEFDTIDDLHDIARFIKKNPDKADEIAKEGRRFAAEHYSDAKIVDKLERILWGKDR